MDHHHGDHHHHSRYQKKKNAHNKTKQKKEKGPPKLWGGSPPQASEEPSWVNTRLVLGLVGLSWAVLVPWVYYSPNVADARGNQPCAAGQWLNGTGLCVACRSGTFDHDRRAATPCIPCRQGFTSTEGAMICVLACGESEVLAADSLGCTADDATTAGLVHVQGRSGVVEWDGRPAHPFVRVRWSDDPASSDLVPLDELSHEHPQARGAPDVGVTVDERLEQLEGWILQAEAAYKVRTTGGADKKKARKKKRRRKVKCAVGQTRVVKWNETGKDAVVCVDCIAGFVDSDSNSSTPCVACAVGSYSAAASTACEDCAASGAVDHDTDTSTPCTRCDAGSYAATGAAVCSSCQGVGGIDHDSDPATPCLPCDVGYHARMGSCARCDAGTYDHDKDARTACVACAVGEYSAPSSTACEACKAGAFDHDRDASTPCRACRAGFTSPPSSLICIA